MRTEVSLIRYAPHSWQAWGASVLRRRFGLALALMLFLASCSLMRLAYYHVDTWLLSEVESYVTLDTEQRDWLADRLRAHHAWHCRTQLPTYVEWLEGLQGQIDAPNSAQIQVLFQQLESFIDVLLAEFAPTLAELLLRLDPAQRTALFARLDQDLAEARTKYLTPHPEERQRERAERLEKRLKPWMGDPTSQQMTRIRQWSTSVDGQSGWLTNRQRLLDAVREVLARTDTSSARRQLVGLFQKPATVRTADYTREVAHARTEAVVLTMDLLRLATDSQRQQLQERIEGLRTDFRALSCAGSATVATTYFE